MHILCVRDEPAAHDAVERRATWEALRGHVAQHLAAVDVDKFARPAIEPVEDVCREDDRRVARSRLVIEEGKEAGAREDVE
jgi:hypothetical protein